MFDKFEVLMSLSFLLFGVSDGHISFVFQNIARKNIIKGVDQWTALSTKSTKLPRTELVYNIKEKPFMAALRWCQSYVYWL